MLPTTALQRLAHYSGQVLGMKAHYPAPPTITTPCLVLYWDETTISEVNEQLWLMTVKGRLHMALKGNPGSEIRVGDALIAPVVDTFSVNAADKRAYLLQTDAGDRVDYCRVERVVPSLLLPYAGHDYYGSELYWGIKLRRFAGSGEM